jgi:hypothetical protein
MSARGPSRRAVPRRLSVAFGAKLTWLDRCWLNPVANDPTATSAGRKKTRRNSRLPFQCTNLSSYIALSPAAKAQRAEKVPRVGWLQGDVSTRPYYGGFPQDLRELGYVEGKNISMVVRSANGELRIWQ